MSIVYKCNLTFCMIFKCIVPHVCYLELVKLLCKFSSVSTYTYIIIYVYYKQYVYDLEHDKSVKINL